MARPIRVAAPPPATESATPERGLTGSDNDRWLPPKAA